MKNENQENFILLPNNLVWDSADQKYTLIKKYNTNKIIHVLAYLDTCINRTGKSVFSLHDMITVSGMAVKSGKNKSIDQFKSLLVQLEKDKIIKTAYDLKNIKVNDLIKCDFQMPLKKDKDGNNTNFFSTSHNTYFSLLEYNGNMNNLILLQIFMYISARISRRETIIYDGYKLDNDIRIHGGKAQCFYDDYHNICKQLDMSQDTFATYIYQLNQLGLVFYGNIGLVKNGQDVHMANNVYCLDKLELDDALDQSKLYYQDSGYELLDKKSNKNMKKINGLKGKIQQQKNSGKDTSKLELKIKELEIKLEDDNSASLLTQSGNDDKYNNYHWDSIDNEPESEPIDEPLINNDDDDDEDKSLYKKLQNTNTDNVRVVNVKKHKSQNDTCNGIDLTDHQIKVLRPYFNDIDEEEMDPIVYNLRIGLYSLEEAFNRFCPFDGLQDYLIEISNYDECEPHEDLYDTDEDEDELPEAVTLTRNWIQNDMIPEHDEYGII